MRKLFGNSKSIYFYISSALLLILYLFNSVSYATDLSKMSWEEVIAQAKQEKQVSWFVWYYQPKFRELARAFEKEYGIKVIIPEGTLDANINKSLAERQRKQGNIDVLAIGSDKLKILLDKKMIVNLSVIPNYLEGYDYIQSIKSNGYALAFWGNQTGLAYDPERIKIEELPQTFASLEKWIQDHPKQFAYNDLNGGGAGGAFIREVIRNLDHDLTTQFGDQLDAKLLNWSNSWKWMDSNKNNIVITASNADSLTRLNDGEFILTAAWEDHLASLQQQGAIASRFKLYIPKFGMSGGGNFVTIPKNAPHPAAALLFTHWLISKETQTLFNQTFGSAPKNKYADTSKSLLPMEQRSYSTGNFPTAYEQEVKTQYIKHVLLAQ